MFGKTALFARTVEQATTFDVNTEKNTDTKGMEQSTKHMNKSNNSISGIAHTLLDDSCVIDELSRPRDLAPAQTAVDPLGEGYGCKYRYQG